jgi:hypothetical protein
VEWTTYLFFSSCIRLISSKTQPEFLWAGFSGGSATKWFAGGLSRRNKAEYVNTPLLGIFQQGYQNSHRILRNLLCSKNFRQFCGSRNWRMFTRPILEAYSTRTSPSISRQMITYLTSWGLSDAQIQLISAMRAKRAWKSISTSHWTRLKRPIRRLSRGSTSKWTPNDARNHRPVRVLVPLWECGSNWRHLNSPEIDGARSIGPAYQVKPPNTSPSGALGAQLPVTRRFI